MVASSFRTAVFSGSSGKSKPLNSSSFSYIDNSFFTHRQLHLDNSCLSYVSNGFIPFLQRGTKSSTNASPKRSKALAFESCLKGVTFWHGKYRDNEELPNSGFVLARHVSSGHTKTRLGTFHLCCIPSVVMKQLYGRSANTLGNATQMELAQTCCCVFTQHMSSENKTVVGQFFVVSVIAMSKRNTI